jgi:hypothetical protein
MKRNLDDITRRFIGKKEECESLQKDYTMLQEKQRSLM